MNGDRPDQLAALAARMAQLRAALSELARQHAARHGGLLRYEGNPPVPASRRAGTLIAEE